MERFRKGKKRSLGNQVYILLNDKTRFGDSKHRAKELEKHEGLESGDITGQYIYSYRTFRNYYDQLRVVAKWMRSNHPEIHNWIDASKCIPEFLNYLIKRSNDPKEKHSPKSIHTTVAALNKLYGTHTINGIAFGVKLPAKSSRETSRGRGTDLTKGRNFSLEKNRKVIEFTSSTGLRKEGLEKVRGRDLFYRDCNWWVTVTEKNGLKREAQIFASGEELKRVLGYFREAGHNKVFPPGERTGFNKGVLHHYRAVYATRVYNAYKRPIETLDKSERYDARKTNKGRRFDRRALEKASNVLGHQRLSVIIESYSHLMDD